MPRPSWDAYFIKLARVVAERATCLRRKNGCLLVRDKYILTTGYCGPPTGIAHCERCIREELEIPSGQRYELCRSIHAEANALIQAARVGVSVVGATAYLTGHPCAMCSRMLIQASVLTWIYPENSPSTRLDEWTYEMLEKGMVERIRV